jgi:replicative DNA helicase
MKGSKQPLASDLLRENGGQSGDDVTFQPFAPLGVGGEPPELPIAVFPAAIREWIVETARARAVPVELTATQALGAISVAANGLGIVAAGEAWTEGLNLWLMTALPSGSNKSAVQQVAFEPIVRFMKDEAEGLGPEIARASEKRELAKAQRTELRRRLKEDPSDSDVERLAELRLAIEAPLPSPPVYFMRDATTEAIIQRLAEDGGIGALVSDEAEILANATGRQGNGPNFDALLQGYSGGSLRVDRKTSQALVVEQARLAVVMVPQPVIIKHLANLPGHVIERGFIARFLIVLPTPMLGKRRLQTREVPAGIVQGYESCIFELLKLRRAGGNRVFKLSAEALNCFEAFYNAIERRLDVDGDLRANSGSAAKLQGACLRLSGLLHLMHPTGPESDVITAMTVRSAIKLSEWFLAHMQLAMDLMQSDPVVCHAQRLWGAFQRHAKPCSEEDNSASGLRTMSRRDLYLQVRTSSFKSKDLGEPLQLLVEHGYVGPVPQSRQKRGGRPRGPIFALNPDALLGKNEPSKPSKPSKPPSADTFEGFEGFEGEISPVNGPQAPPSTANHFHSESRTTDSP